MPHLRSINPKIVLGVPPANVRAAVRAWRDGTATAEQQTRSYHYVVHELSKINQIDYAMPGEESVVNWRQGCRAVGIQIVTAAELVIVEPDPVESPARTQTEKARRRVKKA